MSLDISQGVLDMPPIYFDGQWYKAQRVMNGGRLNMISLIEDCDGCRWIANVRLDHLFRSPNGEICVIPQELERQGYV